MKSSRSDKTPRRSTRSSSVLMALPSDEDDVVSDSVRVTPSPTTPPPESIDTSKKRKHTASKSDPPSKVTSPYFDKGKSKNEEEGDDSDTPVIPAAKRKKKSVSKTDGETSAKPKSATAKTKNDKDSASDSASTQKTAKPKKAAPKKKNSNAADDGDNTPAGGGQPDGHGGLNQPAPFNVEYSKSSRATCRTCDEIIKKGDVRVGHTPLFRGKVNDS